MKYLKRKLFYNEILKPPSFNINDPINKIINKYEEILDIYKNNEGQILKTFYPIRNNIQKILYDNDKIIDIEDLKIKPDIPELFYLSLLLDNSNIINFKYSIDFINNLSNSIKEKSYITQIILSKIIIILIHNAKGLDFYYQNINELKKIKNNHIEIITEFFNQKSDLKIDINTFLNKKIDYIYMEIIIPLIKMNNFNNYEYYEDIFEQLHLQSININETIFDEISKELDIGKNKFLEDYMIKENNIEEKNVINFYEILFKYILKNPLYIYKNKFLMENRNNFINLLKNNYEKLKYLNISQFIFKTLSSPYYEYIKKLNDNQTESNYFNSVQKEQMNDLDKLLSYKLSSTNTENKLYESYAKDKANKIDINTVREMLSKLKIILYIDYNTFKKIIIINTIFMFGDTYQKFIIYEEDLNNNNYNNEKGTHEEKIIYKKYMQFLEFFGNIKEYILKSKIRFKLRIILELEPKDSDMKLISSFENQTLKKEIRFVDHHILANGIKGDNVGFILLINELCDDDYEGEEYSYNNL